MRFESEKYVYLKLRPKFQLRTIKRRQIVGIEGNKNYREHLFISLVALMQSKIELNKVLYKIFPFKPIFIYYTFSFIKCDIFIFFLYCKKVSRRRDLERACSTGFWEGKCGTKREVRRIEESTGKNKKVPATQQYS